MKNRDLLVNNLTKAGGYYKCPNRIFALNLSIGAITIFNYLISCSEDFYPAGRTISKVLRISRTSVIKYLNELVNRNIIKVIEHGGRNRVTKYEFIKPSEWK